MKHRNIQTELKKIDQKTELFKAKKILELHDEFIENPIGFMGIDPKIKEAIEDEILRRQITPKFDSEPRKDRFGEKYQEWNWLNEDTKSPKSVENLQVGLNLKANPFIGESPESFSIVRMMNDNKIKLIDDINNPCNYLKSELEKKESNIQFFRDRCQIVLLSEAEVFEQFVEKIKKKEDYYELMAKQHLPSE